MTTTHTIPSESGQAVLLPSEMAFGDFSVELNIVRDGDFIMIYPAQPMASRMGVAPLPLHPRSEAVPEAEPVEVSEHAWD